jgi:hypothetical protein
MHEESSTRRKVDDSVQDGAMPAYLLDRDPTTRAKVFFFVMLLVISHFYLFIYSVSMFTKQLSCYSTCMFRFSVIQSSRRGRKRLASGMCLFPK